MTNELNRRKFLSHLGASVSAVWISAHWPQMVAAATHAQQAKQSSDHKFEFFTPEEATEVDAISSRIIPSGDSAADKSPGAREAGVIYFIDRALTTFAMDDQQKYRAGLPDFQELTRKTFPDSQNFSSATPEQQDELLTSLTQKNGPATNRRGSREFNSALGAAGDYEAARNLFEALRIHTIAGFLIEPESAGNRSGVGWKWIGRADEHMFQPPFGYYDNEYPGWQAAMKDAEKK